MSASSTIHTLTSSPGKVLIAGGYLVLSPAFPGLVVATDSRFYCLIAPTQEPQPGSPSSSSSSPCVPITVHSPQFQRAAWRFLLDLNQATISLSKESAESPNAGKSPFLCLSLIYCLALAFQQRPLQELKALFGHGLDIHVLADNDFYSQRKDNISPTSEYLRTLAPFNHLSCPISQVHKTGLGSSAALTTSLVSALLIHLRVVSRDLSDQDLALLHNAAQLTHCAAQGKVGSGFDVSSAVWGSQVFRRFDPLALEKLLREVPVIGVEGSDPTPLGRMPDLLSHLNPRHILWRPSPLSAAELSTSSTETNGSHPTAYEGLHCAPSSHSQQHSTTAASAIASLPRPAPLELPPRIEMLLADVDAGSNTPSLVGKVLEWRRKKPDWAKQLYTVLATSNQSLADALLSLKMTYDEDQERYHETLDRASVMKSKAWPAPNASDDPQDPITHLVSARNALRSIRAGMRELGKLSGAPIEPDEMGRLIHSVIETVEGVLGGGVPGAGGYDALYVLYIAEKTDRGAKGGEIEGALLEAKEKGLSVGVLLSQSGGAKGRQVDSESRRGGLRLEEAEKVKGLLEAVGHK